MERWDIYDKDGIQQPGVLVRGQAIPAGRYHLVSCVVVRHENGDFLLMKRAPTKEHFPDIWEIGAAGSVLQGELPLEAAHRELEEETGISGGVWSELDRYVQRDTIYCGFLCVTDIDQCAVRLQEGETVDFRWLTPAEFLRFFYSEHCLQRFRNRLGEYVKTITPSLL